MVENKPILEDGTVVPMSEYKYAKRIISRFEKIVKLLEKTNFPDIKQNVLIHQQPEKFDVVIRIHNIMELENSFLRRLKRILKPEKIVFYVFAGSNYGEIRCDLSERFD